MNTSDQIAFSVYGLTLLIIGQTGDNPIIDIPFTFAGLYLVIWANRTHKNRKDTTA